MTPTKQGSIFDQVPFLSCRKIGKGYSHRSDAIRDGFQKWSDLGPRVILVKLDLDHMIRIVISVIGSFVGIWLIPTRQSEGRERNRPAILCEIWKNVVKHTTHTSVSWNNRKQQRVMFMSSIRDKTPFVHDYFFTDELFY